MSIFYKSINEKLIEHISELDKLGLLPVDWSWNEKQIKELDQLTDKLLEDLMLLHASHQDLGHTVPHIIPLIKQLHDEVQSLSEKHLKQGSGKTVLVNKLLDHLRNCLERQGYVRYGKFSGPIMYLTPREIAYYNTLVDKGKWKDTLRYLKNKWNERVDRHFIQSVHTIHWGDIDDIESALTTMPRNHELSCVGYKKTPYPCLWIGGIGLFVKGWCTLAGNMDLQTKQWTGFGKGHRYTEYGERLVLNEKTFTSKAGYDPSASFITHGAPHNEFMIANWKPIALVVDIDKIKTKSYEKYIGSNPSKVKIINFLKQFSKKYNLPLLNNNGNQI